VAPVKPLGARRGSTSPTGWPAMPATWRRLRGWAWNWTGTPSSRWPTGRRGKGRAVLDRALHGGEDYELLVALPRALEGQGWRNSGERFDLSLSPVGRVVAGEGVHLRPPDGGDPVPSAGRVGPLRTRTRRRIPSVIRTVSFSSPASSSPSPLGVGPVLRPDPGPVGPRPLQPGLQLLGAGHGAAGRGPGAPGGRDPREAGPPPGGGGEPPELVRRLRARGFLPGRARFVAKEELRRIPLFGAAWETCGHIRVNRGDRAEAVRSLNEAGARIRDERLNVILFPEGTRSADGHLLPSRRAPSSWPSRPGSRSFRWAFRGAGSHGQGILRTIRPGEIRVRVGEPIPVDGLTTADRDRLLARARTEVLALMEDPADAPPPAGRPRHPHCPRAPLHPPPARMPVPHPRDPRRPRVSTLKITRYAGREILDSRGNPTVEAEVDLEGGPWDGPPFPPGPPPGSTRRWSCVTGTRRYLGRGVRKAVANLGAGGRGDPGLDAEDQEGVDDALIERRRDPEQGAPGANALLAASLASARAAAEARGLPLFEPWGGRGDPPPRPHDEHPERRFPRPEQRGPPGVHGHAGGGRHLLRGLRMGVEIFHHLKNVLSEQGRGTAVGDEGGFAPDLGSNEEAVEVILRAIERAGFRPGEDVVLALDAAASEFYGTASTPSAGPRASGGMPGAMVDFWRGLAGPLPHRLPRGPHGRERLGGVEGPHPCGGGPGAARGRRHLRDEHRRSWSGGSGKGRPMPS
jgi:hypothetical protein